MILFLAIFLILGVFFTFTFLMCSETDIWREKNIKKYQEPSRQSFEFQSIDTMKYSRDLSREKLEDEFFDAVIEKQIRDIARTGVTHVAIATPYDDEFYPFLKKWVDEARKHNLKVWFRGNWSGWEGWFEYPSISKEDHLEKTKNFILDNPSLFEDGDFFSSCPECENGREGDPRQTGKVDEYRRFLIDEYNLMNSSFKRINKKVKTNLFSMNGDVAKLIMDKKTTQALGGIVTIDHYVATPEKLVSDVEDLAQSSGGKIFLGEFGAPIPDIHGEMNEYQQAKWINNTLFNLQKSNSVIGVNYWLNVGGSTGIWNGSGRAKTAVDIINKYYVLNVAYGLVYNELGRPIKNAVVSFGSKKARTNKDGYYELKFTQNWKNGKVIFSAPGYLSQEVEMNSDVERKDVVMIREDKNIIYKAKIIIRNWINGK